MRRRFRHIAIIVAMAIVVTALFSRPRAQGILGVKGPGVCGGDARQVLSVPLIAGNSTQQIITAGSTQMVYICGYGWSNAAAGTAKLFYGTGTFCGTGSGNITGTIVGSQPAVQSNGPPVFGPAPMGKNICIVAGGTTPNIQGWLSFVYGQPNLATATPTGTATPAPTNTPAPTPT